MKTDSIRLVKPGDIFVALSLILAGYWLLAGFKPSAGEGKTALIQVNNSIEYELDLGREKLIDLNEFSPPVRVQILDNSIRIIQNDCEQKICIKMGAISEPGQMIVCVPKKILIFIPIGNNEHRINAITG
jgi:hypothetical protein